MMPSAPVNRAADTDQMLREQGINRATVGTAVRSKIAISAPVGDGLVQRVFHRSLGALAIQRADERKRADCVTSKLRILQSRTLLRIGAKQENHKVRFRLMMLIIFREQRNILSGNCLIFKASWRKQMPKYHYRTAFSLVIASAAAAVALAVMMPPLAAQDQRGGGGGGGTSASPGGGGMSASPGGGGGSGKSASPDGGAGGPSANAPGGDRGGRTMSGGNGRDRSASGSSRGRTGSASNNERTSRSFSNERRRDADNRRHHRRNGVGVTFGYDGGDYSGSCRYYHRRAVATGSGYWWRRYHRCIGD